jgi:uncharacterized protein YndB with AHSA1/START domain
MATSHLRVVERIEGPQELVFDLIADMPNYGRWLSRSDVFDGTAEVSPYPVHLGTTYVDEGPAGKRPGSVTAYERPRFIAFHHSMQVKSDPLNADVDVRICCTVDAEGRATRVTRDVDLTIHMTGLFKLAEPLVVYILRRENARVLAELKRYVEEKCKPRTPWRANATPR